MKNMVLFFVLIILLFSSVGCGGEGPTNPEYTITPIGSPVNTTGGGTITAFQFSSGSTSRRFDVYLPPSYDESTDEQYPVLYMNDGQNLFDAARSYVGEWCVDENVENLISQGEIREIIVVGVDNAGAQRMEEYTTNQARWYSNMLMAIKSHIDETYRTLSGRQYTGLMGSSAGALVTLYAAHHYPETFGMLGVYSLYAPNTDVDDMIEDNNYTRFNRVYIAAGAKEPYNLAAAQRIQALFQAKGYSADELFFYEDPDGSHNELTWNRWLRGEGTGLIQGTLTMFYGINQG